MSLSFNDAQLLLKEHHLLIDSSKGVADEFTSVTYDSRKVTPESLFFCKGNFKAEYLASAVEKGATGYVSEKKYATSAQLAYLIVKDVQKAMALLGAAFYGYPQNDLFIIGITGTKGKTTSAYLTKGILDQANHGKTALFSTVDRTVGPRPEDTFKSNLTTPESLDLFHDMRTAVDNGMTHLVMEVSSQAYKKNRVYGLHYNVGVFLNISPDHVGENEHPTFEDYLFCKEQILANSDYCILNADTEHFTDIYYAAKSDIDADHLITFTHLDKNELPDGKQIDIQIENVKETLMASTFKLHALSKKAQDLKIENQYTISIPGDYNEGNATSAIIAALLAKVQSNDAVKGLKDVKIAGRMEMVETKQHGLVYIDYAHNYASLHALLEFLRSQQKVNHLIVVVGSTGNKGVSRRAGFGKAITEGADYAILTSDDPGYEDPMQIAKEIDQHIDHEKVKVQFELDREKAIAQAITMAHPGDVVVLAGKGEDKYQKINGVDTPYPNDLNVAKKIVEGLEDE